LTFLHRYTVNIIIMILGVKIRNIIYSIAIMLLIGVGLNLSYLSASEGISPAFEKEWMEKNPESLPIWMTEEERQRKDEIGKDFLATLPPLAPIRQPAEFEPVEGVLIRYEFGISPAIIAEIAEDLIVYCVVSAAQQSSAYTTMANGGVNMDNVQFINCATDSYWIRDYGPWFVFDGNREPGIVDFIYNRPRPFDDAVPGFVGDYLDVEVYGMDIVHTGGNYMTDGRGISVSTDLVWEENPNYTHSQIDSIMYEYLGINTYHVVSDVNGEYIKHIDCWAKYLAPDVIMIREVPPSHPQYDEIEDAVSYFESQMSCYRTPYTVCRVYTPGNEPYTNSLIINNKVLVPITGSQWDDEAIASYEAAMPGYEVLGFAGSWASTDALHCRTKGVVDRGMLYIYHNPLPDTLLTESSYFIGTTIIPYSGEPLITDSVLVYWKTAEQEEFSAIQMEHGPGDFYSASIPPQPEGTIVEYYIHAADSSGRSETNPYMGPLAPHSFYVEYPHGITENDELPDLYEYNFLQNHPNPFSTSTTISFNIPTNYTNLHEKARIKIYNIKGQLVKEFKIKNSKLKIDNVVWDGTDMNGRQVPSGVYLYQLSVGDFQVNRRMLLLR
jgi:agmatine/peptidylarginine deiminase